mgnify:FL=1
MFTIVETPLYIKMVDSLLTKEEQGELHTMISQNPDIGDVVSKSGGVRTVRFARQGGGKSGGVRGIYYTRLANGKLFMLLGYAKATPENIPAHILKDLVKELDTWQ